ncbi:GspMb/PilO family protein [Planctomycetota bacterium]
MKLSAKKYCITTALIWTGCFILFLFMYMLVLVPQSVLSKDVEKQLAEKERTYKLALKAAEEETRNEMDTNIKGLRDKLSGFVIDAEDLANLMFDISQIAKEKQVGSFSVKSKKDEMVSSIPNCQYVAENTIDLSFDGSFNQFATLLNSLERHKPVIFIDEFSITQSSRADIGHQVNMDLAVFVKKEQKG